METKGTTHEDYPTPSDDQRPGDVTFDTETPATQDTTAMQLLSEESGPAAGEEGCVQEEGGANDQEGECSGEVEQPRDELGNKTSRKQQRGAAAIAVEKNQQRQETHTVAPEEEEPSAEAPFAWGAPKHIFVLSSAGKPVFSLLGDEQKLSTLMGFIQGLLSLCADCDDGDEIESVCAGSRRFVFLRRGDLVLVAVSSSSSSTLPSPPSDDGSCERGDNTGGDENHREVINGVARGGPGVEEPECESFLRLQLEYMYASILFLLTSKVQAIFRRSPGYDLRGLLGGAESSLKGVIDLAEPPRGRGRLLAGGVETVWMDPAIRARVARALQGAQAVAAPGALYAIWLCGEELVSLAQPRAPSHRLDSRDLLLLVNFVATQPALRNAESWTPVCFPRFQEKGYLYAYIAFLDDPPSTNTANPRSHGQGQGVTNNHVGVSDGGLGGENEERTARTGGNSCVILVSAEASSEQFQAFRRARTALETRFRSALGNSWDRCLGTGASIERERILTKFCSQMHALHFYYCLRGRRGGAPCVTQCLSSPFADPLKDDVVAQRTIWGRYTRAALRLRRGSSQECRVSCREEDAGFANSGSMAGGQRGEPGEGGEGEGRREEATALFESDPVHSAAYEIGTGQTVVSLFGQRDDASGGGRWTYSPGDRNRGDRDELHACFPPSVDPELAYKAAARLVAIIRRDKDWLFLTGTGASK